MNDKKPNHSHASHAGVVKRLKRANGHLGSVIEMINDERSCLDIAQQLHAVEKAIHNAKKVLIEDHIDHCLDSALNNRTLDSQKMLDEFKAITKYL